MSFFLSLLFIQTKNGWSPEQEDLNHTSIISYPDKLSATAPPKFSIASTVQTDWFRQFVAYWIVLLKTELSVPSLISDLRFLSHFASAN